MVGETSMNPKPEQERTVNSAWIFDVDGVITNPETKRVSDPKIYDEIIKRLQKKEPVALVTGRAHKWIIDRVVIEIENRIKDKHLLDNFFISEEFGGSYSIYENGVRKDFVNEPLSMSSEIPFEVKKIVEDKFSDSMFIDPDKKTMVSIEMKDNFPVEEFKSFQDKLVAEIQEIVNRYDKEHQLEIHEDTIATNIRNKKSNKRNAAKQMLEWLLSKGIKPQKYLVFGDTTGDKEIAQEINENGMPVEFVFVGKEDVVTSAFPFAIHQTQAKFENGTLEYLKSL